MNILADDSSCLGRSCIDRNFTFSLKVLFDHIVDVLSGGTVHRCVQLAIQVGVTVLTTLFEFHWLFLYFDSLNRITCINPIVVLSREISCHISNFTHDFGSRNLFLHDIEKAIKVSVVVVN